MRISDWSSDVCSSDLLGAAATRRRPVVSGSGAQRRNLRPVRRQAPPARLQGGMETDAGLRLRRADDPQTPVPCRQTRWPADRLAVTDARQGPDPVPHRSEEHTSELQSLMRISYAVFCLKKNNSRHES